MTLNANALVTLATAKDFLDIGSGDSSQDTRVTNLINAISDHAEILTSRKLVWDGSTSYVHYFNGDPLNPSQLLLWQFPIITVSEVAIDRTWAFAGGSILAGGEYAPHRDIVLQRRYPGLWPTEKRSIRVTYTAGYTTGAVPGDLQEAACLAIQWLFDNRDQRKLGVASRTKLGESTAFGDKLPEPIMQLFNQYVRETYVARKLLEV